MRCYIRDNYIRDDCTKGDYMRDNYTRDDCTKREHTSYAVIITTIK